MTSEDLERLQVIAARTHPSPCGIQACDDMRWLIEHLIMSDVLVKALFDAYTLRVVPVQEGAE